MPATSRLDLDAELYRNDETRNNEDFEDGEYPALGRNNDRREPAHHVVTGHNAPHNIVPEYLATIQNNPLPQQFTQP